jgi:hypothetical protein
MGLGITTIKNLFVIKFPGLAEFLKAGTFA